MRPLFSRIGSKYNIRDYICGKLPDEFDTYVEPFVGGGSVFFNLDLRDKAVVLNDKDAGVMEAYRLVGVVDFAKLPVVGTKEEMRRLIRSGVTDEERLMGYLYRAANSFMSVGRDYLWKSNTLATKVRDMAKYRAKLSGVTLLNEDGLDVIRRYDGERVCFFIDPPYEASDELYKHDAVDLEALADVLCGVRGKFVLTLNHSPRVRELFGRFVVEEYVVRAGSVLGKIAGRDRRELLIRNFAP